MIIRKFTAAFAAIMLVVAPVQAARESEPIKVTSAKNLTGTQRVVIGQFAIGFIIERKDSSKAGGGLMGNGFGGRSTVRSTLAGYTPEDLQQITNTAYDDFAAKLTAAGFEVADRAALAAVPAIAREAGEAAPREFTTVTGRDDKAKVMVVGASQTSPLRIMPGDVMVGGFGAIGMNMAAGRVQGAQSTFAKETGTRVINVIYYIDFATSEEYGGWFRSSSAVKVNGSLALIPDYSKVTVVGADYKTGMLTLKDPVAVGGDFFEKEDTMSGTEKATNRVANVIGFLGGVGTNSSKKFSFTARPGAYVSGVGQATGEANSAMAQKLAALR
jgi:hypothetical protein